MNTSHEWIEKLGLERHREGGWFREVYRSSETIPNSALPDRFDGDRTFSTAIYFLLESDDYSALHRIRQDEIWHFYAGSPLTVHCIDSDGAYSKVHVGESPMAVIPAGWLFGATVDVPGGFALLGCTVAPGFEFADFEMPARGDLIAAYPEHTAIIERLTA
jgi:predicted cupin superfamily sugar epimerase